MSNHLHLLLPFSIRAGQGPAYRQLARFMEGLVQSGLLSPGDRLPAEREVAAATGLSRTTVTAAYAELVARGLAEARVGTGTFVAPPTSPPAFSAVSPPWAEPPAVALDQVLSLATGPEQPPGAVISFVVGAPAPDLAPSSLPDAMAGALAQWGGLLPPHSPPAGLWELRCAIAAWMGGASPSPFPDEVLVTTGSQQGLYLVAQWLLRPGDAVLVERPTFFGALQLFKALGAYPVEFDLSALQPEQLRRHKPRLIYVNPTFRNPSGSLVDLDGRRRILDLARRLEIPVVEDDPYRELWFASPPPPRLWELAGDQPDVPIVTLGTVSKLLSPAIRLGWVVAKGPVLRTLMGLKQVSDLHTSLLSQGLALYYLQEVRLAAHAAAMRERCRRRRDRLIAALREHLPMAEFCPPDGGFYVWARLPGVNTLDLFPRAINHGVSFVPGPSFHAAGDGADWLRLSFASPPEELIGDGVRRLARALAELRQGP